MTSLPFQPPREDLELEIARDIASAELSGSSPMEVYRTALGRIAPLLGADFASIYLRDDRDPDLLRLACALNWPQASARFLGELRIREGRGPTGQAVQTGRPVHVVDLFRDPAQRDWREAARELGFVSMIALPLTAGDQVLGAVSFYFRERQSFEKETLALLGVVAHQLAATAARARRSGRSHWKDVREPSGRSRADDR